MPSAKPPLRPAAERIVEEDAFLAEALEAASVPTLMMCLVQITGDTGLLDGPIVPGPCVMGEVQGGLSREDRASVRQRALEVLARLRDEDPPLPPPPEPETLHRMMSFMVGQPVPDEYVPMMLEELALDGSDARDLGWRAGPLGRDFRVLVIGAGMSGLLTAIRLQEAGIPFVVVEKNEGLGGTWYENTYPGCRVDVASHFYCFSFEPNDHWSEHFARADELRDYFQRCAERHDLLARIRFGTEVEAARFDEERGVWRVTLRTKEGREETLDANAIVSAVGQLNRARIPEIPGLERFAGPAFHSSHYEHDHDLGDKRVAVIGTGASALQLVPEVAKQARHLDVYQRSAPWMFPNPSYHARVRPGLQWLLRHVPYYARWYRFLLFWPGSDGLLPSLVVDPGWPHPDRAVNAQNDATRQLFTDYMASQIHDDPELLEKVVPRYPPFVKRMLQDNGSWLATLQREDVDLVTEGIREICEDGVVTNDSVLHPADVLIFATGFHANRFLWPMEIVGRGGLRLREHWGDDPRAYLGITVPGFPNLFCLYGPGTNLAHAGSIIFHSECQVRYLMGCLEALLEGDYDVMECRQSVHDAYNERLDEALSKLVFSYEKERSWYKNSQGRVTTTSPWRLVDYWRWTRRPETADFEWSHAKRSPAEAADPIARSETP